MRSQVSKNNTPGTSSGINLNANNMATESLVETTMRASALETTMRASAFGTTTRTSRMETTTRTSQVAGWKLDSDVQSFDDTYQTRAIQNRTTRVIGTIAGSVEGQSIPLKPLREITECLLDMNDNVAKVIQDCQKDMGNDKELSELLDEYFEGSLQTLKICNALKKCLQRATNSLLPVRLALQYFDEDTEKVGNSQYARTLQELKNFKAAGHPFTKEFLEEFRSVHDKQKRLLDKLKDKRDKLEKKLNDARTWRKAFSIVFLATAASLIICSAVVAALSFPHVAVALATVAAIPTGPVGKWIDSLWKEYANALEGQLKKTNSAYDDKRASITELDHVKTGIDGLKDLIESMMNTVDCAIVHEAVKATVKDIKDQLQDFAKGIEDLKVHADKCSSGVMAKREEVLQGREKLPHN